MPDEPRWETHNNAYLRAALRWLRLRLAGALPTPAAPPPAAPLSAVVVAPPPDDRSSSDGTRWRRRRAAANTPPSPAAPASSAPTPPALPTDAEIDAAARAMDAASVGDPPPALLVLQDRLGLSRFERDVLLLAAAPEFDTSFGRLYADAQGDPTRRHATFALAMSVFEEPRWEALAPHRPLRHFELLTGPGTDSVVAAPLRVPERVVNFVKGLSHLDGRLAELTAPFDVPVDAAPGPTRSQRPAVEAIVASMTRPGGGPANLVGADRASKQLVAAAAAARLGLRLVRLPVANLPSGVAEITALSRLLDREQLLSPIALYLDAGDADPGIPGSGPVDRLLAAGGGPILIDSREPWQGLPHRGVLVDVARPTPAEQRAAWQSATGDVGIAADTAAEFDLDLDLIHAVADGTAGAGDARAVAVREACRARCRPRLGPLAQRLVPRQGESALVLRPAVVEQLRMIEQQVRGRATVLHEWGMAEQATRGLGTAVLFAGEPGVGKTAAAEELAGRLDLDLYRIDLSGVVSKYIGETEKNLRAVFDAADRGGAVLFFDEADALFGKRSEVRDSHDRYANIEVSYLLARMETYRGLAILATNLKRGMDDAFARRLRLCVDFPFPGEDERARIWAGAFPPGAALRGIDHGRLARLALAGGAIRNVAVNAAFMAAAATPQEVTMAMVLDAARAEYRKLGLPASTTDFHWREPAAVVA